MMIPEQELEVVEPNEHNSPEVNYGTLIDDVDLPEKLEVTLSDDSNKKQPIT